MTDSLVFQDYDAYGFDIDHTIAKYNIPNLFDAVYNSMSSYLIGLNKYDNDILSKPFSDHADFCTRGIVLDNVRGHFLKLSENGYIIKASHGTTFLSEEEIVKIYGTARLWDHYEELIDKVNNLDTHARVFENFFDMPMMVVCARVVDCVIAGSTPPPPDLDFCTYFNDVLQGAEHCYGQENFRLRRGGFFDLWRSRTSDYVYECSRRVTAWLKSLRKVNGVRRQVFLLTSSRADYAIESMEFVLGDNWRDMFDIVVTDAKKPGFFNKNRPFLDLKGETLTDHQAENLRPDEIYAQGNANQLMSSLEKLTGKKNPKVLFFGDSMRSDSAPAKHSMNWETVLVLEEIIAEHNPETGKDQVENEKNYPSSREKRYLTSHSWGSLFTDHVKAAASASIGDEDKKDVGSKKVESGTRMNTLWGYVIRKYADLAIPQLEYITDFPLDHKYEVFDHNAQRAWGFYPYTPVALQ